MLSPGLLNLAKLVGGWSLGLGLFAVALVHQEEIRTALGLRLSPEDLGIVAETPRTEPEPVVREVIRYVEREAHPRDDQSAQAPAPRRRSRGGDDELFKQQVRLRSDARGHFEANASINGRTVGVLVDTGATLVALSYEDAVTAGVAPRADEFRYVSNTANGQARFARVRLDEVRIGPISVRDVDAAVGQPGKLGTTLLGMSFLSKVRFESRGGVLTLEQ